MALPGAGRRDPRRASARGRDDLQGGRRRLDLGGGKGVICAPAEGLERRPAPGGAARLRRPGRVARRPLHHRRGRRHLARRPGRRSRERTEHVTGLPPDRGGSGDPSPFTAIGVEAAIRACARARFGEERLAGPQRRASSASATSARGSRGGSPTRAASWCVSDIDPDKRALADELGAAWVEPEDAMTTECDVLAPCALGRRDHRRERADAAVRRSSAARPTTSSPTIRSPRPSPTAGSSTRRISSPTQVA